MLQPGRITAQDIVKAMNLKPRASQEKMWELVADAIKKRHTHIIEAPTGTGKSFGYLIPAILYAVPEHRKVIVTTHSKNLQDQLAGDLKRLQDAFSEFGISFTYFILKGKNNYLCLDRWCQAYRSVELNLPPVSGEPEDINIPSEVLLAIGDRACEDTEWLVDGNASFNQWTGDLTSLPRTTGISPHYVQALGVSDEYCTDDYREGCPYKNRCYYYSKVKALEMIADIIVCNHALLAFKYVQGLDRDTQSGILTEQLKDSVLVIDEAHELDEAIRSAYEKRLSAIAIERLLQSIEKIDPELTFGFDVHKKLHAIFDRYFPPDKSSVPVTRIEFALDFSLFLEDLRKIVDQAYSIVKCKACELLKSNPYLSPKMKAERLLQVFPELQNRFKIAPTKQTDVELNTKAEELIRRYLWIDESFKSVSGKIKDICDKEEIPPDSEWKMRIDREGTDPNYIYQIVSFPVISAPFLKKLHTSQPFSTIICTSATLSFEKFQRETGIKGHYTSLPPVFDHSRMQIVVYSVNRKDEEWYSMMRDAVKLALARHETVLVLATSLSHIEFLRKTFPFSICVSSKHHNVQTALRELQSRPRGKRLLVGVDSLWTGVNIKGEKGIVITSIPFAVPDDPAVKLRGQYFYHRHNITELALSADDAAMQMKQGIGRLLRDEADSGVIYILDNRVFKYTQFRELLRHFKKHGARIRVMDRSCLNV